MINKKFAVFILTHGRSDKVITYRTLRKQGYTGDVYFLLDDQDTEIDQYMQIYGKDRVIVFDKQKQASETDCGDITGDLRVVVYARNRCFREAQKLGLDCFLQLDDDYSKFEHRYIHDGKLRAKRVQNLDLLFEYMIDFLYETDSTVVAFAQGGDLSGGIKNQFLKKGLLRKAMNTFFMRTDKPVEFKGRLNEDVTMYVTGDIRGEKIFTYQFVDVTQIDTQKQKGGLSDIYLDMGTYYKSFFSVMYAPSCVKITSMGDRHLRLHHRINWKNCAPMILDEKYGRKKCWL